MNRKLIRFILALVVVGVVVFIAVWRYTFRKAETSVSSAKAELEILATDLVKKFENNEDSANAAFLDKVILVIGTVDNVKQDSTGTNIYIKEQGEMAGVMCSFSNDMVDPVGIKTGEQLRVKGICTGYLLDVVINKCSLEK